MGNWVCFVGKAPGCFRACARLIRRYEKVDKIDARAFRGIHARSISIPGLYSPLLVVLVLRSFGRIQVRKSYYYQPIPDISDLERRNIWNMKKDLSWINFSPDMQLDLLLKLGQRFGLECVWPLNKTENPLQFYTENSAFSYGCAASLYSIIRNYKPKYIIEIGSGNSSLVIHEALLANNDGKKYVNSNYTIIDPYPGNIVKSHLNQYINLIEERLELVNIDIFKKLGKNDILFIDSSHIVRIGGDVNRLILDIIPNLSPGVIIHFHDIPFPYEYPKIYSTNPVFRMFWTESYLLQAFLLFNKEFEIILAMNYLMQDHMDVFKKAFRNYDETNMFGISGSFWIRRIE